MTNSQSVPKQWSWNPKLGFLKIFQNSPKNPNSWKNSNSQTRAGLNSWKWEARRIPALHLTPIHKLSMMFKVWNISIGQVGLAVWLCSLPASAQLLISWIWETGKSPWFIATTENISVINIILLLNPKHSSYWEENELYPSWNQDTASGNSAVFH